MSRIFLVASLILGLVAPAWADFQAGQAAFDNGDYKAALDHWRPLAEHGSAAAQWRLASMYHKGQGIPQDRAAAAKWLRLAAEQGLPVAQLNLGGLYEIGDGVRRNLIRAHKWYSLATAGYPPGVERDRAARNRDRVAIKLSPRRLADAQALARRWHWDPESQSGAGGTPATRKLVVDVQRTLVDLGYDPGPVDGVLGPRTRAAVRAFQADRDLRVSGELSIDLFREMRLVRAARGKGVRASVFADDPRGGPLDNRRARVVSMSYMPEDCAGVGGSTARAGGAHAQPVCADGAANQRSHGDR